MLDGLTAGEVGLGAAMPRQVQDLESTLEDEVAGQGSLAALTHHSAFLADDQTDILRGLFRKRTTSIRLNPRKVLFTFIEIHPPRELIGRILLGFFSGVCGIGFQKPIRFRWHFAQRQGQAVTRWFNGKGFCKSRHSVLATVVRYVGVADPNCIGGMRRGRPASFHDCDDEDKNYCDDSNLRICSSSQGVPFSPCPTTDANDQKSHNPPREHRNRGRSQREILYLRECFSIVIPTFLTLGSTPRLIGE
jgi:hypothetical protein